MLVPVHAQYVHVPNCLGYVSVTDVMYNNMYKKQSTCFLMQMLHTDSIAPGVKMYLQNVEGSSQRKTRASGSMNESFG